MHNDNDNTHRSLSYQKLRNTIMQYIFEPCTSTETRKIEKLKSKRATKTETTQKQSLQFSFVRRLCGKTCPEKMKKSLSNDMVMRGVPKGLQSLDALYFRRTLRTLRTLSRSFSCLTSGLCLSLSPSLNSFSLLIFPLPVYLLAWFCVKPGFCSLHVSSPSSLLSSFRCCAPVFLFLHLCLLLLLNLQYFARFLIIAMERMNDNMQTTNATR